jgi:hypothetical protein
VNESLTSLTRQLAQTLSSDEGSIVLARMQRLALAAARMPMPPRPDSGLRLGIWEPRAAEDGSLEFARIAAASDEWRYWADVDRIPRKTGRRVVLVGESVARAYLFDPELTLAGMLSASLGVEVVDLARTDLGADHLPPLFDALPVLQPDAVVLFAGNNWCGIRLQLEELDLLANAVRTGGFSPSRALFLEMIRGRARSTLDAIAARLEGIPLCVVVPEFNLQDWRSEPSVMVPILPEIERWLDLAREGSAGEMIALDGGTSAVSQHLAASQALARGDVAGARQRFEAARDAPCGLMTAHSPRCPAVVQDELRAAATRHGFHLVDLPALFAPLPDRRMFLDYCHLTGEGLCAATTAITGTVAPIVGATPAPPREPDPHIAACAHLLAAVHNAHYGQPEEIVGYHAARARELDPGIGEFAAAIAEIVARRSEAWLCRAWQAIDREPQGRRYLGAVEMLRAPRVADITLADALASAAGNHRLVDDVLIEEAAPLPLDLLAAKHRATTFRDVIGQGLGPVPGFVRATAPRSRFVVVRAAAEIVTARITLRAAGDVAIVVNGAESARVPARTHWTATEFGLKLNRGRNVIELAWPTPRPDAAVEFERAARRLERGLYPDVLIAFGEVHAFTAG